MQPTLSTISGIHLSETQIPQMASQVTESLHDIHKEKVREEDYDEEGLEEAENEPYTHRFSSPKRKTVKLCRHKLQQGATNGHRIKVRQPWQQGEHWQKEPEGLEQIYDPEWSKLREAEEYCHWQREKLLREEKRRKQGFHFQTHANHKAPKHNSHIFSGPAETEPDEAELEYITSLLESFANPGTTSTHKNHRGKHQTFSQKWIKLSTQELRQASGDAARI
jgi:hypothetical protein